MKNALKTFSLIVIFLFILSLFGWMVNQISNNNKKFGFLTEPIKYMYSFPDFFKQSVEEVKTLPRTFMPTPADFKPINKLDFDLLVLSTFSDTGDTRSVVLRNLRNDSILKKWTFENPHDPHCRILNPILYPDGSLVYNFYYWAKPGIFKISPSGEVLWNDDSLVVHHAINLNKDGDVWASTALAGKATGVYKLGGKQVFFSDYRFSKYNGETGEIMFDKSISEILTENNLGNYIFKSADTKEPIHANDVQPALKTTPYYQEDDVFVSVRNLSIILHYRPSTNELIRLIEGPFINQHDVDIFNDSILLIFNNNTYVDISRTGKPPHNDMNHAVNTGDYYSNIVSYNLKTNKFGIVGEEVFRKNEIFTVNEGLFEFIDSSTYFVEEQNEGLLWVIRNDSVIYKDVFRSQHEGYHHLPNWNRIIKKTDLP